MLLGELFPNLRELFEEVQALADEAEELADEAEAQAQVEDSRADYEVAEADAEDDIAYLSELTERVLSGDENAYSELRDVSGALGAYGEWQYIAENALAEYEARELERSATALEEVADVLEAGEQVALEAAEQVALEPGDFIDLLGEVAALVELRAEAADDDKDAFLELAGELYEKMLAQVDEIPDEFQSMLDSAWSSTERVEAWARGGEWVGIDWEVEIVRGGEKPEGKLHSAYESIDDARAAIAEIGVDAFTIWEVGEHEIYLVDHGTNGVVSVVSV